jgi:hypothetical protein
VALHETINMPLYNALTNELQAFSALIGRNQLLETGTQSASDDDDDADDNDSDDGEHKSPQKVKTLSMS